MVLEIPGGLFGQSDVRETATKSTETQFWSCAGINFKAQNPNSDDVSYTTTEGNIQTDAVISTTFYAPVNIPHGAVIIAAFGSASEGNWQLRRVDTSNFGDGVASGANSTESTTITNSTINNSTHAYFFVFTNISGSGEAIGYARVTYTLQQ